MAADTSPLLVIASHNAGKIKEFQQVLGAHWRVQPQADFAVPEAEETGSTFVENALLKARHACSLTGHAALADDSGLVVPALGGAPGLRSARYSGSGYEANNALLLNNMAALQGAQSSGVLYRSGRALARCARPYSAHRRRPMARTHRRRTARCRAALATTLSLSPTEAPCTQLNSHPLKKTA